MAQRIFVYFVYSNFYLNKCQVIKPHDVNLPFVTHIGPLVRGDTSPRLAAANAATKLSCKYIFYESLGVKQ